MNLDSSVLKAFLTIIVYIGSCQGEWSDWAQWSTCSVTCGYGIMKRQKQWLYSMPSNGDIPFVYEDIHECQPDTPCPREASCFKKFRPKSDTCGGLYKKKVFASPDHCCSGLGQGFTLEALNLLSHNKYTCVSCDDWNSKRTTPSSVQEDFQCFRRFRDRQRTCGGPLKKNTPTSPEECCNGPGSGFYRYGLDKLRQNQYTCSSCEEWRSQNNTKTDPLTTTTTEAPSPSWWSHWGDCSTSCGHGTQTRYRLCNNCDRKHHSNMQVQDCVINFFCPIDGGWGDWVSWEHCSVSCNGGFRRRERKCDSPKPKHGGRVCVGADLKEETCNPQPCPVDGHWGQWSRFGRCSATCGLGTMVRKRECNSPSPKYGGKPCHGPKTNGRRCEQRKCPVHGGWTSWNQWSQCPVTCGTGARTRSRECNDPPPFFGGRPCSGSATEHGTCEAGNPCPVDGGWSRWTSYGRCRAAPCQRGHKLRSRVCNNPRPRNGGQLCRGRAVERMSCINTDNCRGVAAPPVDGGWCEFSAWSSCSATCQTFSAVETRSRICECPAPENGGNPCTGDTTEYRDCMGTQPCDLPVVDVDER